MNFSEQMKTEIINLYIMPNSKVTEVGGKYLDRVKIKISSPPERDKANKELLKFLSQKLNIPRKSIKIISGKTSKFKQVKILNIPQKDTISNLLKN